MSLVSHFSKNTWGTFLKNRQKNSEMYKIKIVKKVKK